MAIERPSGFDVKDGEQPSDTTILISNLDDLITVVALPGEGTLWIAYEYAGNEPAKRVYLWHQGGESVTIQPGIGVELPSRHGDMLVYELANPTQSIKLGWGYV